MGCDIHLWVEYRESQSDPWKMHDDPIRECWSCDGTGFSHTWRKPRDGEDASGAREGYDGQRWLVRLDDEGRGVECPYCQEPSGERLERMAELVVKVMEEDPESYPSEEAAWNEVDWYRRTRVGEPGKRRESFYSNRNYDAFAILADVRNGYGFAGVTTGEGFVPIDPPRGVPEDASPEYKMEVQSWGQDGHSHSHFTVRELMNWHGWGFGTALTGWVSPTEYAQFKAHGQPRSWSGGVSGAGVHHVSNEEMDKLIADGTVAVKEHQEGLISDASYYTQVWWRRTYEQAASDFRQVLKDDLMPLGRKYGYDNVRIVFFFDN